MEDPLADSDTSPSRQRWPSRLLRWGGQLLLLVLLVQAVDWFMSRDALRGVPPAITVQTLTQEPFSLPQSAEQASILYFWASWCPICRAELGTVESLAEEYPLMSIAMQSGSDDELRGYLREQSIAFPVINDESGELSRQFGVTAVPAFFILNRHGEITHVTRGITSSWGIRARLWLADILDGQ